MTIQSMTTQLTTQIELINKLIKEAKAEFENIINDESISLEDRLDLFSEVPDYLHNQRADCYALGSEFVDLISESHYERRETVDIYEFLINYEENMEYYKENNISGYNPDYKQISEKYFRKMLQKNISKCVYDW